MGGPKPDAVADLVSEATAEDMENAIATRGRNTATSREHVLNQLEASDDS